MKTDASLDKRCSLVRLRFGCLAQLLSVMWLLLRPSLGCLLDNRSSLLLRVRFKIRLCFFSMLLFLCVYFYTYLSILILLCLSV